MHNAALIMDKIYARGSIKINNNAIGTQYQVHSTQYPVEYTVTEYTESCGDLSMESSTNLDTFGIMGVGPGTLVSSRAKRKGWRVQ